jgi:predicted ATP-binding protein involved in virulence
MGEEALEKTPGVVIIDELDLHLHPRWQRHVIHDLKRTFPSVQFVATTHSPQLIGEAQPEEIRKIDGDEVTTPLRSYGIDSSRVLEEVMDAKSRNNSVEELLGRLFGLIDKEDFSAASNLLHQVEEKLGPDDPEVTRARTLMTFLESKA